MRASQRRRHFKRGYGRHYSLLFFSQFARSYGTCRVSAQFYMSIKPFIISQNVGLRQDVEVDIRAPTGMASASVHNTEGLESLVRTDVHTESTRCG
eukprot:SAG11_NODE_652_length_7925_cov_3.950166_6_plen_96_part_00